MSVTYHYLDYAASAPLRPEAVSARDAYEALACAQANPNSLHSLGREASRHLEDARRTMARCLGGGFRPADIVFCGGGTEADNLAVYGIAEAMRAKDPARTTVILSAIEHDAVRDLAAPLKGRGFRVETVAPGRDGIVEPASVEALLDERTALVALMAANNETGAVQPIGAVGAAVKAAGATFMVDGIQAFGRIPLDLTSVDAFTLAGHKIGAPVGTAVLALKRRVPFIPTLIGGGQESGRRPGTQDVAGAVALAAVSKLLCPHIPETRALVAGRAQAMVDAILAGSDAIRPTLPGPMDDRRLPGVVNLLVDGVESESLILALDAAGYGVSAGSACSTGSLDPSHVLLAMGIGRDEAFGSLRVSFDERVEDDVLQGFASTLCQVVAELRSREGL